MGGFRAVEDRPTPKEVYNWRLYFEAAVIAFGSMLFGYDGAFIGTTITRASFKKDFGITAATSNNVSSNITSVYQAGAFFGAIFCFFITEQIGRKWALQSSLVVFFIGAILTVAATDQLSYIYAGRILTGLACGALTATVPNYIAELSIPSIRGILTGLFEIAYQIGSVIGFWINYGITETLDPNTLASWRIPMAVQFIPSGLLFFGAFFLHESPQWLLRKERDAEAYKALEELRQLPVDNQYVQEELQMIRGKIAEEAAIASRYGTGPWALFRGAMYEFSRKGMRNRVSIVICAFILQNMSGAAAINYYSPTLFGSIGITNVTLYTGIYGLVKAVSSIIFYIFLIDLWGRRNPTILSSLACSICLWIIGAYVKIGEPGVILAAGGTLSPSNVAGGKAATGMVMIYSVFWSFGLNGIPWIVSAEMFPVGLRNFSGTLAALGNWLWGFVITKALPYIFTSFGYGTWFFFASFMLLATAWAFFFLRETKGLTMDQMDVIFGYVDERRAADTTEIKKTSKEEEREVKQEEA